MTTHAGIFSTEEQAKQAYDKLVEAGVTDEDLKMFSASSGAQFEELLKSGRGDFLEPVANRLRNALQAGKALIIVTARLFADSPTMSILEESGAEKIHTISQATPKFFSEVIGLPRLVYRGNPAARLTKSRTPFSSMFGIPLLASPTKDRKSSFGMPLLTKGDTIIPMQTLIRRRKSK